MSKKHKKSIKHKLEIAFIGAISLGLLGAGAGLLWFSTIDIPAIDSFGNRRVVESTKIYDRTGEVLLYEIARDKKRTIVSFNEIARNAKNAAVAIEDEEFYEHKGVKPKAFLRAVWANLRSQSFGQGGSTITQQVVKNTLLTAEKKVSRKIKEWILAIKLEQVLSKEEILGIYLNEAPYGGLIYGIEQASTAFFGKTAKELTLAESAYLAALPQSPTRYSPYGNNTDELETRKNKVLVQMLNNSFITDQEYKEALAEEVVFLPRDPFGIKAPHFVVWVQEYLVNKYGERAVEEGGLKIITTLDYELQQKAEEIVKRIATTNEENFNAKNAGMIGLNPKTGELLVMVGSRDYFDVENEGNFNITLASNRQPGSAFKPFVYATAFMKGYTPDTVVFDLETQFQTTCPAAGEELPVGFDDSECYTPRNYDNIYRGPVTLRDALAQSINVPAVKALYLAGLRDSFNTAKKMGITGLTNPNQYGLTLVLGGGEVSLIDMTSAYGVFANKGIRNPYVSVLRVEDKNGNVLEEFTPQPVRVIPEQIALQISDVLSDNKARTPAFGARSPLYFEGRAVAAKTGTTNEYRDAWIIGYTPSFALGTWAGNNDNTSMEKKVAGFVVAPMWNEFMKEALAVIPNESFASPTTDNTTETKPIFRGIWKGNQQYFVDSISQKLATAFTPEELKEERVVTQVHSALYWIDKNNPNGPFPTRPENDPQFLLWEKPVRSWVERQQIQEETIESIPQEYDNIHTPESAPVITLTSPTPSQVFNNNQRVDVRITSSGIYPLSRVEFFVNDVFVGTSKTAPFSFSFTPTDLGTLKAVNNLKVVAYDTILNKKTVTQLFNLEF